MIKGLVWVVIITIGVFFGALVYEKYSAYRVQQETARLLEQQAAAQKARQEARVVELEHQRKQQLEQDTLCAMNTDTGKCTCINKVTGMKLAKSVDECQRRASSSAGAVQRQN